MNVQDITAIIGAITGCLGFVTALVAIRQTHVGTKTAEDANVMAEQANREAGTANQLAENANKISLDANAIAQRALSASVDQIDYHWVVEVDKERHTMLVINDCDHSVTDVTVTILKDGERFGHGSIDGLAAYGKFEISLQPQCDELIEQYRRRTHPAFGFYPIDLRIDISWVSELGMHRNQRGVKSFDCFDLSNIERH